MADIPHVDAVKLMEARRRDQETISTQMIGFGLVAEGALAAAYTQANHGTTQFWIAASGVLAGLTLLAFYVRTRIVELAVSRWIAEHGLHSMNAVERDVRSSGKWRGNPLDDARVVWIGRVRYLYLWTACCCSSSPDGQSLLSSARLPGPPWSQSDSSSPLRR